MSLTRCRGHISSELFKIFAIAAGCIFPEKTNIFFVVGCIFFPEQFEKITHLTENIERNLNFSVVVMVYLCVALFIKNGLFTGNPQ